MICDYLSLRLDVAQSPACLPWNNTKLSKNVFHHCVIAGVPVVQHPAMSRPEEDHSLDSLDARQHLRQRRPLWATIPLHLQSSHTGCEPARSGKAEDRDALLLQRRINRLLHWRWVQSGKDWWTFSSYLSLWMFLCYLPPTGFLCLCRLVIGLLASSHSPCLCVSVVH